MDSKFCSLIVLGRLVPALRRGMRACAGTSRGPGDCPAGRMRLRSGPARNLEGLAFGVAALLALAGCKEGKGKAETVSLLEKNHHLFCTVCRLLPPCVYLYVDVFGYARRRLQAIPPLVINQTLDDSISHFRSARIRYNVSLDNLF